MLKIGHGNVYAANRRPRRAARLIRSLDCDSFGVNEGKNILRHLQRVRGYRVLYDQHGTDLRGTRDTPLLVRDDREALGSLTMRVSEAAPAFDRVAPDRWLTVAMYRHPFGDIAHLNLHPVAGPDVLRGSDPHHPLVRRYQSSTDAVEDVLRMVKARGFLPVFTGDVQVPPSAPTRPWSLYPVLRRAGLVVESRFLDVIGWDARLDLRGLDVIGEDATGSDHPWLVARLGR